MAQRFGSQVGDTVTNATPDSFNTPPEMISASLKLSDGVLEERLIAISRAERRGMRANYGRR
jgi:hypothetical protein